MSDILITIETHDVDPRYLEVRVPIPAKVSAIMVEADQYAVDVSDREIGPSFDTYPAVRITSPFGPRRVYVRKNDQWFLDVLLRVASDVGRDYMAEIKRETMREILDACDQELGNRLGGHPLKSASYGLEWIATLHAIPWSSRALDAEQAAGRGTFGRTP